MAEYTGPERREMPPCTVPCKPISDKLDKIENCTRSKAPFKFVLWLFGGLAFFVVVIIGGTQWTIIDRIGKIETSTAVMAAAITETQNALVIHRNETDRHNDRIRSLELRESSRHPEYYRQKR